MAKLAVLGLLAAACGKAEPPPSRGAPTAVMTAPPARLAHPVADAATGASPKHGEGPALVVADKVDGAALRSRHRERIKADRSPVTILTGGTARELGQRICEASVPMRPPETPVLIKPNMSELGRRCGGRRASCGWAPGR